ncbi:MAG: flagellar biosynthetic protein FliO [Steroidobacteraceae bacterium]
MRYWHWYCIAALLVPGWVLAGAGERVAFAAPRPTLTDSGGFGMLRVCVALAFVVAAVYAVAWLMRRLRNGVGANAPGLTVVSQVSLGTRERAVLLRVGAQHLLLGVAAGSVRLLQEVTVSAPPADAPASPAGERPNFRELLRRSLGR